MTAEEIASAAADGFAVEMEGCVDA
jgi:hypothetical protein